jgi:hypothetical protein
VSPRFNTRIDGQWGRISRSEWPILLHVHTPAKNPGNASVAYILAWGTLAQKYTDDDLIHSLLLERRPDRCTPGSYEDYDRAHYSGNFQTWYDCGVYGTTAFAVTAAPEGRECVVVLDARLVGGSDHDTIHHLIDTFEVNCGLVIS